MLHITNVSLSVERERETFSADDLSSALFLAPFLLSSLLVFLHSLSFLAHSMCPDKFVGIVELLNKVSMLYLHLYNLMQVIWFIDKHELSPSNSCGYRIHCKAFDLCTHYAHFNFILRCSRVWRLDVMCPCLKFNQCQLLTVAWSW